MVEFGIGFGVFDSMSMNIAKKSQGFGDFPLGDFVNLEMDFFPEGINSVLAVLAYKNEDGQENGFEGDEQSEKGERKGIKVVHEQDPENEEGDMEEKEEEASGGPVNVVGQSFRELAVLLEFGFQ